MVSRQKRYKNKTSFIFLAFSTLAVLLAGSLALLWQLEHRESSRADAGYVVGAPTLPAATVNQIFARVGSPMAGTGDVVEQASRRTNIDDAFALAVWWTETNDGAAGVGLADRNPGSVRGNAGYPAAFDGYTIYPSYATAIDDWFTLLRNRYVNRGLTSAYTICYPYVGTSGAASWAAKVVNLMLRYHGEAPAPVTSAPPTPITQAPAPPAAAQPTPRPAIHKNAPTPAATASNSQPQSDSGKNVPEARSEEHRPITVGQWQSSIEGSGQALGPEKGKGLRPDSQPGRLGQLTNQPFTIQYLLIGLVLLAAASALIAGPRIRRRVQIQQRFSRAERIAVGEKTTGRLGQLEFNSYLSLYVNGPVPLAQRKTDTLEQMETVPATPTLGGSGMVPLTPFVAGGGSRGRGEVVFRRARLVPVGQGRAASMERVDEVPLK